MFNFLKSKDVKEAERIVRENERHLAHEDRLSLIKEYDKKVENARREMEREKNMEIAQLKSLIKEKSDVYAKFRRDLDNLETLVAEMSALGIAIENLTGGITGKFHGFKTRTELIRLSVVKKERKYQELLERLK
jgi:hypothetical protein